VIYLGRIAVAAEAYPNLEIQHALQVSEELAELCLVNAEDALRYDRHREQSTESVLDQVKQIDDQTVHDHEYRVDHRQLENQN